jgi:hypothetical protein
MLAKPRRRPEAVHAFCEVFQSYEQEVAKLQVRFHGQRGRIGRPGGPGGFLPMRA